MADALQLLREDHNKVKELFKRFEEAENAADKKRIADQAMTELEVHAQLEEEVFYPAVRRESDAEDLLMEEAVEEHNVADALIDELRTMSRVDTHYEAKFMVLAEAVKHHIQEEESEMLPKAAEVGMDRMRQLGEQMGRRAVHDVVDGVEPQPVEVVVADPVQGVVDDEVPHRARARTVEVHRVAPRRPVAIRP